jgi:Family of unknown function (DUF6790)
MKSFSKFMSKHFVVLYLVIAISLALYDIFIHGRPVVESFLLYFLFINIGILGLISFFLHWRRITADKLAKGIGWAPGSPFQREVAAADGAFGILGVLCYFIYGDFWTATVIGASFMYFFMGVGHILDIKNNKNFSPLNAGSIVYYDILLPVVLIILLILWKMGV